ncbi:MAG: hypothetical protein IT304_03135 [Dehalococcoidia bacterium]|nr:hypothetical protein [Dehalococcoidia bacterium]
MSETTVAVIGPAAYPASAAVLLERLDVLSEDGVTRVVLLVVDPLAWPSGLTLSPGELRAVERTALPLVATLSGEVSGAALDVALACDVRLCDSETRLLRLPVGGRRLLQLIGPTRSVDLVRAAGTADARFALEAGLVSAVVPAGEAPAVGAQLCATIAARGPIATRLGKEAVWRGLDLPLEQALRFETDLTLLLQTTKDRAEGVRAFLEKRPPTFTGN